MKYFLTLLTCLLLAATSQSQMRLGVLGGPHSANVIEKNDIPGWDSTVEPWYLKRKGFNIGFIAEIPLGPLQQIILSARYHVSFQRKTLRTLQ